MQKMSERFDDYKRWCKRCGELFTTKHKQGTICRKCNMWRKKK